tara:strand:- start:123 stop:434 length:312 start_codon:yes stop_codon:yes gene_type:complete
MISRYCNIISEDWDGPSYMQGTLVNVTAENIQAILGEANSQDDPDKFDKSWRFIVKIRALPEYYDTFCNIWDWYGSGSQNVWSFYGPPLIMRELFGKINVRAM